MIAAIDMVASLITATTQLPANSVFTGLMPDQPSKCVSLMDYTGDPPLYVLGQTAPVEMTTRIQVLVRAETLTDVRELAMQTWGPLVTVHDHLIPNDQRATLTVL